ncbi:hypothetical protein KQI63_08730 [bacterium]|nr:hypothetical protein [bacterium]
MVRYAITVLILATLLYPLPAEAQGPAWPADDPDQWLLAFVDVETTGLIPGYHEMIDGGFVYTDLAGNEVGRLFVRIMPEQLDRISEGAVAVNGFDVELWKERGCVTPVEAVEQIAAFHDSVTAGKQVMLVALNSHFDSAFLDHLMRGQNRSWREFYHYFILDIPSMAWSLGLRGLTGTALSDTLGIKDEPHDPLLHTGITGALVNVRIYRALLDYRTSFTRDQGNWDK